MTVVETSRSDSIHESTVSDKHDLVHTEAHESVKSVYEYLFDQKKEVRLMAIKIIAGLSCDEAGPATDLLVFDPKKYAAPLVSKLSDHPKVAALSWDALTNFAANHRRISIYLADHHLDRILSIICSSDDVFAEAATKLLSNMTKHKSESLDPSTMLPILVPLLRTGSAHNPSCNYDFLASVVADLTNSTEGCEYFLEGLESGVDKLSSVLLPELLGSVERGANRGNCLRRGGAAAAIKNCLFNVDHHQAILKREEQIGNDGDFFLIAALASRLLDVRSQLSDQELEALPLELQLLDRSSESDLAIRSMIIESLIILGTTKRGRECMRKKEIYPILREWHKLEPERDMGELLVKLVELLIRDEE